MSRSTKRTLFFVIFAAFLALQTWASFVYLDGGIAGRYTFKEGFTEFVNMSFADPLLTAGFIDFMTIALVFAIILVADIPRGQRMGWRTWVFLIAYIVFPGLGLLLYLLVLFPNSSLMRDSPA
jgi:hypothetical protein